MREGLFVVLVTACACGGGSAAPDAAAPDAAPDAELDYPPASGVDLLFVLDNSNAVLQEIQIAIADAFGELVAELETIHGSRPALHVGVITQDMGAGGHLFSPDCVGTGDGGVLQINDCPGIDGLFLRDEGGVVNYTGTIEEAFSCMARLDLDGCGFEQPLASLAAALDPATLENAGFLRDAAALAVVILQEEDDCSAIDTTLYDPDATAEVGPLHSYRCFEHGVVCDPDAPREPGVKTGCQPRVGRFFDDPRAAADALVAAKAPGWVRVLTITPPLDPIEVVLNPEDPTIVQLETSCPPGGNNGLPAVRLDAFTRALGGRAMWTSICPQDYRAPLRVFAAEIAEMLD